MKRAALALVGCVFAVGTAVAEPDQCGIPDYLSHTGGRLRHVAAALTANRLNVLVVGTGSSALRGPNGAGEAYPARLQAALAKQFPAVTSTVRTDVQPRRATLDMIKDLQKDVLDAKPDVVVWQTGTVDAMRNVDPDDFRAALEKGVSLLRAAGVDVILVNMQYSPQTEPMITPTAYADAMHLVAEQTDTPLFDRLSIMRYWNETGVFDLSSPHAPHLAERVHDCLGRLLAGVIVQTAAAGAPDVSAPPPSKDNH